MTRFRFENRKPVDSKCYNESDVMPRCPTTNTYLIMPIFCFPVPCFVLTLFQTIFYVNSGFACGPGAHSTWLSTLEQPFAIVLRDHAISLLACDFVN